MTRPSIIKRFFRETQERVDAKIFEIEARIEQKIPAFLLPLPRGLLEVNPCCKPLGAMKGINSPALKPMAHGVLDVGQILADCAPISWIAPMSEIQYEACKKHRRYFEEPGAFYSDSIEEILRKYFAIFDDLYFFGTVRRGTILQFKDLRTRRKDVLGSTRRASGNRWSRKHETVITIDLDEHLRARDEGEDRMNCVMGTLLHEMIHAFMDLYTCACWDRGCWEKSKAMLGPSGHGPPWHIAAAAIEESVKKVLGRNLDLGREDTLWHEIREKKDHDGWHDWPLPEEFERLRMDPDEFETRMELRSKWEWNEQRDKIRRICRPSDCDVGRATQAAEDSIVPAAGAAVFDSMSVFSGFSSEETLIPATPRPTPVEPQPHIPMSSISPILLPLPALPTLYPTTSAHQPQTAISSMPSMSSISSISSMSWISPNLLPLRALPTVYPTSSESQPHIPIPSISPISLPPPYRSTKSTTSSSSLPPPPPFTSSSEPPSSTTTRIAAPLTPTILTEIQQRLYNGESATITWHNTSSAHNQAESQSLEAAAVQRQKLQEELCALSRNSTVGSTAQRQKLQEESCASLSRNSITTSKTAPPRPSSRGEVSNSYFRGEISGMWKSLLAGNSGMN